MRSFQLPRFDQSLRRPLGDAGGTPPSDQQGGGLIVQVSSIGGISAFPNIGAYHASKWALEEFSQALAQEVAPFGIRVTIVEPGGFSTDWGGASARHATPMPAYDSVRRMAAEFRESRM